MKTFETQKHNIPEGATHYFKESEIEHFAWWNDSAQMLLAPAGENEWVNPNELDDISNPIPIPQAKDAEWVNGEKCRCANDIEHEYIYIGAHPHGDGHCVFSEDTGITYIANGYLLEPETEAEKLERQRLETIDAMIGDILTIDFDGSVGGKVKKVCAALYDLGYRKGK